MYTPFLAAQQNRQPLDEQAKVIKDIETLIDRRGQVEEQITRGSEEIGSLERGFERVNEEINQVVIEKTKNDTQLEGLNQEYEKYEGVETLEKSMKDLKEDLEKLEEKLATFGSINMRAIETFQQVQREYEETWRWNGSKYEKAPESQVDHIEFYGGPD